jgi:RNA-binding protein NOB1
MYDDCYNALVLDSGAIINQSSLQLIQKAKTLYTVEGVIQEVRDAKSKEYLDLLQLQKQILIREPSKQATHIVSNFARSTGDYSYLSRVDIQVIGLQYDLGMYESFPLSF